MKKGESRDLSDIRQDCPSNRTQPLQAVGEQVYCIGGVGQPLPHRGQTSGLSIVGKYTPLIGMHRPPKLGPGSKKKRDEHNAERCMPRQRMAFKGSFCPSSTYSVSLTGLEHKFLFRTTAGQVDGFFLGDDDDSRLDDFGWLGKKVFSILILHIFCINC